MATIVRSYTTDTNVPLVVWVPIGASQTIANGDLIQIDGTSRKGIAAVASSTTIVGIAQQAITTGASVTAKDKIPVALVRGFVVRLDVNIGGTKTTFADTDKYTTAFNLSNKTQVNPDNTTNGMLNVQDYNNTAHTVDVIFSASSLAHVG